MSSDKSIGQKAQDVAHAVTEMKDAVMSQASDALKGAAKVESNSTLY